MKHEVTPSSVDKALIFGCRLNGHGGADFFPFSQLQADWPKKSGLLWAHLNLKNPKTAEWVENDSGIHAILTETLLAERTRPSVQLEDGGILLSLKGVSYEKGADPEDMISLRVWITKTRIVSLRAERSMSVEDLRLKLVENKGIENSGDFLVGLLDRIVTRMHDVIEDLEEELDTLEENSLGGANPNSRTRLATLRQQTVGLRKHLHPQRDVLASLPKLNIPWLSETQHLELIAITEKQTRYVEELDYIRERSMILQEQLNGFASESLVKKMYFLAIITFIFDPLTLIVGLWGTNVGGIPGAESRGGFWGILGVLLGVATLILYLLRKRRWF